MPGLISRHENRHIWGLSWFSQSFQENTGTVPRIRPVQYPSLSFTVQYLVTWHSTPCVVATNNVVLIRQQTQDRRCQVTFSSNMSSVNYLKLTLFLNKTVNCKWLHKSFASTLSVLSFLSLVNSGNDSVHKEILSRLTSMCAFNVFIRCYRYFKLDSLEG